MTTIVWPLASFPFINNPSAFKESGPQGNVIRTPMENGPVKTRRRFTAATRSMSGETDILTTAQVDLFDQWFENVIASGALPFRAINPRTEVEQVYRIVDGYEIIHIDDNKHRIGLSLEVLP